MSILRIIQNFKIMKKIFSIFILACALKAQAGIIADTLYLEARGEGEHGQRAVATVIYNRAQNTGKTFEAVCLQPFQFSCWNASKTRKITPKTRSDTKAYELCLAIEKELLTGNFELLGEWTHYYNPRLCNPKWAQDGQSKTQIGNHIFLKTR